MCIFKYIMYYNNLFLNFVEVFLDEKKKKNNPVAAGSIKIIHKAQEF